MELACEKKSDYLNGVLKENLVTDGSCQYFICVHADRILLFTLDGASTAYKLGEWEYQWNYSPNADTWQILE